MIIFDLLKKDHDDIKAVLDTLERAPPADASLATATFEQLRLVVAAHTKAEEEVFYSVLQDHDRTEEMAEQGEDQHEAIEEMLGQLADEEIGDGPWRMIFEQMAAALRLHIADEEGEMFRAARTVLGETDLTAMAEAFVVRRERALVSEQEALHRRSA